MQLSPQHVAATGLMTVLPHSWPQAAQGSRQLRQLCAGRHECMPQTWSMGAGHDVLSWSKRQCFLSQRLCSPHLGAKSCLLVKVVYLSG
jgi:hypothetical protein